MTYDENRTPKNPAPTADAARAPSISNTPHSTSTPPDSDNPPKPDIDLPTRHLTLRIVALALTVAFACLAAPLLAHLISARGLESLALSAMFGLVAGAGLGLLLIALPDRRAAAKRDRLIDLIDNLSTIQRRAAFDLLLRFDERGELNHLTRALHRVITSAHADRLQAAALRRDMDARVARQTKLATSHLTKQSCTDDLTHLANRRGFDSAFNQMVADANETADNLALLAIDLDHFKVINDTLGHDKGDETLRVVAQVLGGNLRETDLAARIGGDEFLIVLFGLRARDAESVAKRLLALLAQHPFGKTLPCPWVTISIGIAMLQDRDPPTPERLRKAADEALYTVKRSARGTIHIAPSDNKPVTPALPSNETRSTRERPPQTKPPDNKAAA